MSQVRDAAENRPEQELLTGISRSKGQNKLRQLLNGDVHVDATLPGVFAKPNY